MRSVLALLLLSLLMLGVAPCDDGSTGDEGGSSADGSSSPDSPGSSTTDGTDGSSTTNGSSTTPGTDDAPGTGGTGPGDSSTPGGDGAAGADVPPGDGESDVPPGDGGADLPPGDGESDVPPGDGGGETDTPACDLRCEPGQFCKLQDVVCVRAPCPPVPTCTDRPFCGGIAGFACPGAGECGDDPSDDCDPNNGGADCGGICSCAETGRCPDGQRWDASPEVCGCVGGSVIAGDSCGGKTCAAGEFCCNPSCGTCAPAGGACTQQICESDA